MPLYEYECPTCEKVVECLQKMDDPAPDCEKCGKQTTKKVSRSGFILKGGGWAADGYSGK